MNHQPVNNEISRQFMSLSRPPKPKMLVVDDEPDNLDLLYRTFRRDFNVFRAESGLVALDVLKNEGEVAVIISDQRMPEMKGTEFLSKTVPDFPDTMRIILTGFTDVEDLVEAINSGQVYKYITKPWDPNELRLVVQRAAETYELLKQRTEELRRAQAQTNLLSEIVRVAQVAATPEACLQPIAKAFGENFQVDTCVLQLVTGGTELGAAGIYAPSGDLVSWLAEDPVTQAAMTEQKAQAIANVSSDTILASLPIYQNSGVQGHIVVPILYRQQTLAVLSLQWKQLTALREDELFLIDLSAQQVALALVCTKG